LLDRAIAAEVPPTEPSTPVKCGDEIRVHAANEALVPPLTVAQIVLMRGREFWRGARFGE